MEDQDEYEHAYHEDRVPRQWLPPYDGTTQPPLSTCLSPGTSLRSASSLSLSVSDTSSAQQVSYTSGGLFPMNYATDAVSSVSLKFGHPIFRSLPPRHCVTRQHQMSCRHGRATEGWAQCSSAPARRWAATGAMLFPIHSPELRPSASPPCVPGCPKPPRLQD